MANPIIRKTGVATEGRGGQIHYYGWQDEEFSYISDHYATLDFELITKFSHGHHMRGGDGNDVFNFVNLSNVQSTIVGRLEDFDPTHDRIQIEGVDLDLNDLPNNIRVVRFNGEHNDKDAVPQQWLHIDTGGGNVFYALEGARIDMQGKGAANDGQQEAHFLRFAPDFSSLVTVDYENPFNFVPAGYTPDGGLVINDSHARGKYFRWGDRTLEDVHEVIHGSDKGDLIAGGLNDDIIHSGNGDDVVWGGDGNDRILSGQGNDTIYGNSGNDVLMGGNGDDFIYGGDGNDMLIGGNGDDWLYGGDGNDRLSGGAGNDTLIGGAGSDRFVFRLGHEQDVIMDFEDDIDILNFIDFDVNSVTEVLKLATQSGNDVIFDFGSGDILTVLNMTIGALADDIVFG